MLLFYILLLYVVAADLAGYPHEHPEDQAGGLRQARTIRSNGERHGIRIKTEEKAKVVATAWGEARIHLKGQCHEKS